VLFQIDDLDPVRLRAHRVGADRLQFAARLVDRVDRHPAEFMPTDGRNLPRGSIAKRERLSRCGPLRGFVGTVSQVVDLIDEYQDAGVQLLINSDHRNDIETHELLAAEVMPHFA
jgi:alkanesulfonate monooxygenase SsuD/methylene tetrahydromethanopterin reductase-like flavin-dependent oxidoreductase (luciferase family)